MVELLSALEGLPGGEFDMDITRSKSTVDTGQSLSTQ